jgi:hypothetical protein
LKSVKTALWKRSRLPIVIPLLICHGKRAWPENTARFSSLLAGPVKELSDYIPDSCFDLYDLTCFTDDEDIDGK